MTAYYEDITLHVKEHLGPFLLKEKDIIDFAGVWDPLPMHTQPGSDGVIANGQVIASGFHLLAICQKLFIEQSPIAVVIGLGIDEVKFQNPGLPGDRLTLEIEAIEKRESVSRPSAGIVTRYSRLLNQEAHGILTYKGTGMVEKREKNV